MTELIFNKNEAAAKAKKARRLTGAKSWER